MLRPNHFAHHAADGVFFHLGEVDFLRGNMIEAKRNFRKFLEATTPGTPEAVAAQKRIDQITTGKGN